MKIFFCLVGNCKEDCVPVSRFLKKVVLDISDLEKTIFTVNCNGTPVDVKFRISSYACMWLIQVGQKSHQMVR